MFVIAVSAVPVPSFKKANLRPLSKASIENNHNGNTNFFAATIENENETVELSGGKIWNKHGFLNVIRSNFHMEKVNYLNYPENTLFYINQAYLTVKRTKRYFIVITSSSARLYMNDISNSNLTRNVDGVRSRREVDTPADWIGENSQHIPPQKFKTSY